MCGVLIRSSLDPEFAIYTSSRGDSGSKKKPYRTCSCLEIPQLNAPQKLPLLLLACFLLLLLSGCGAKTVVNGASYETLVASPNTVAFGSVSVGQTASNQVSVSNGSSTSVTITRIDLIGESFSVAGASNLPVTLAAGDAYKLNVQFNPAAAGTATGQLSIASDTSATGQATISLNGTGTTNTPAPAALSAFSCSSGSMTGSGRDACTVTLTAAAPTGGLSVSLSSSNAAVVAPTMVTVPANATSAGFTTTVASVGTMQTVTLTATSGTVSKSFALQLNAAVSTLSINATSITFGDVKVNTAATQSVTLTSTGTAPVKINAATLTGQGFSLLGTNFPAALNPGQAVTLEVQFDPATTGAATGQLTVTSNSSTNPAAVVNVSGSGTPGSFTLTGLLSPATVSESIFVAASGAPSTTANVAYFVDDRLLATENMAPFWMGGQVSGVPTGLSIDSLSVGTHYLSAEATLTDGSTVRSSVITLNVLPSMNSQFSATLSPYLNQLTAQTPSLASVLANTSTPGASLTSLEFATREAVLTMYLNWGIDPSLDWANDSSSVLGNLAPKKWQPPLLNGSATPLSMSFSPDAPYYHAIPALWPRIPLPSGYFNRLELNSAYGGDGLGFGETVGSATDPQFTVTSEWYTVKATLRTFPFRMKSTWYENLPTLVAGDSHVIFVDSVSNAFVSAYKTTLNTTTGGPDALYASSPTSLNSLGDHGGSIAAGFADLALMVQPGEATNPTTPIQHAIGGPVGRTWAARVYPASARDAGVLTSTNSCTGVGYTNTGLIPYGGVIQLDPQLDLKTLKLSLPALRILQAMQTYGYYVMDFGCADIDIYTSIPETEIEPYGGAFGNAKGPGVQFEVQNVITSHNLYVVAPLMKKQ